MLQGILWLWLFVFPPPGYLDDRGRWHPQLTELDTLTMTEDTFTAKELAQARRQRAQELAEDAHWLRNQVFRALAESATLDLTDTLIEARHGGKDL